MVQLGSFAAPIDRRNSEYICKRSLAAVESILATSDVHHIVIGESASEIRAGSSAQLATRRRIDTSSIKDVLQPVRVAFLFLLVTRRRANDKSRRRISNQESPQFPDLILIFFLVQFSLVGGCSLSNSEPIFPAIAHFPFFFDPPDDRVTPAGETFSLHLLKITGPKIDEGVHFAPEESGLQNGKGRGA